MPFQVGEQRDHDPPLLCLLKKRGIVSQIDTIEDVGGRVRRHFGKTIGQHRTGGGQGRDMTIRTANVFKQFPSVLGLAAEVHNRRREGRIENMQGGYLADTDFVDHAIAIPVHPFPNQFHGLHTEVELHCLHIERANGGELAFAAKGADHQVRIHPFELRGIARAALFAGDAAERDPFGHQGDARSGVLPGLGSELLQIQGHFFSQQLHPTRAEHKGRVDKPTREVFFAPAGGVHPGDFRHDVRTPRPDTAHAEPGGYGRITQDGMTFHAGLRVESIDAQKSSVPLESGARFKHVRLGRTHRAMPVPIELGKRG